MESKQIQALIEDGKSIERRSGMLRQAIINLATGNGRRVTELDVQKVINFISEYIEHALALMMLIEDAALNSGVQHDVQPVLDATEDYFLAEDDIIPDHLGLVGLVDDAYLTHKLMQAISDRYRSQSGESLLPLDPQQDNAFVRRLIGEPFVTILDDHVAATLDGLTVQQNIKQILLALGQMNLSSGPDPIWGNTRTTEISDSRLTVIGVF